MTERALITQMLDALEYPHSPQSWYQKTCLEHASITAAREYLAEPEQSEPVNQMLLNALKAVLSLIKMNAPELSGKTIGYARAAIAKAEQAPEQSAPIGEIVAEDMGHPFSAMRIRTHFYKEVPAVGTKLYTAAPQPTELSDAELERLVPWRRDAAGEDYFDRIEFARAVFNASRGNK